jgi:hypothetical protein
MRDFAKYTARIAKAAAAADRVLEVLDTDRRSAIDPTPCPPADARRPALRRRALPVPRRRRRCSTASTARARRHERRVRRALGGREVDGRQLGLAAARRRRGVHVDRRPRPAGVQAAVAAQRVAVVLQDNVLFGGTVRENLTVGLDGVDDAACAAPPSSPAPTASSRRCRRLRHPRRRARRHPLRWAAAAARDRPRGAARHPRPRPGRADDRTRRGEPTPDRRGALAPRSRPHHRADHARPEARAARRPHRLPRRRRRGRTGVPRRTARAGGRYAATYRAQVAAEAARARRRALRGRGPREPRRRDARRARPRAPGAGAPARRRTASRPSSTRAFGECGSDAVVGGAELVYLRYKPETSCLAAFELDLGGAPRSSTPRPTRRTTATSTPRRASASGATTARSACRVSRGTTSVVVRGFPNDLVLARLAQGRPRRPSAGGASCSGSRPTGRNCGTPT